MSSIFSAYNTPRGAPLVQEIYCLNLEFGVLEIGNFNANRGTLWPLYFAFYLVLQKLIAACHLRRRCPGHYHAGHITNFGSGSEGDPSS